MSIADIKLKQGETIHDLQRNGYRIIQSADRFCFGMDAVLLSEFASHKKADSILDMGSGTGIISILMAAKTNARKLVGIELQAESADMAMRSVMLNELESRVRIMVGDIRVASNIFSKGEFDIITTNPPYMIASHGMIGDNDSKTIARHEVMCTLEDVVRESSLLLNNGGVFYMVHRPFRLPEIMVILNHYKLEPKRMRMVHPYIDKEPNMVLIEAIKGGRPRITIEKPLVVYDSNGEYNKEIYDVYGY